MGTEEKKVYEGLIRIFEVFGHTYYFELISQIEHKGVIPEWCPLPKEKFLEVLHLSYTEFIETRKHKL